MSLKHDIDEYPEMWSNELVAAFEDYKNGKWNSKRRLRKFVNREISEYYYNELVKKYAFLHRTNREELEIERKRKIKGIFSAVILLFSLLSTICYLIEQDKGHFAFWYFILYMWAISNIDEESQSKIVCLKLENKLLKDKLKNYNKNQ